MSHRSASVEQILIQLVETPLQIAALTAGLTESQLQSAPSPGEWSINEVLAHLRACADVWGECMATIIHQSAPVMRAVNTMSWIKRTDYLELEFQPSLKAFSAQRAGLLAVLEALTPEAWSRSATVTGAGKPLVKTVQDYAFRMAVHERRHVGEIQLIAGS